MAIPESSTETSNSYLHIFLWAVVPSLVTSLIQKTYYRFAYGSNPDARPVNGGDRYRLHYNRIFTGVVLAYLSYSVVQVYSQIPCNYYAELQLQPGQIIIKDLKSNFRRLSLQAHPDKNGGDDGRFLRLRQAFESLNDPIRRFGYDRFGLSQKDCPTCKTRTDYMTAGLPSMLAYYVGVGAVMGCIGLAGRGNFGRYWRWLAFITLLVAESTLRIWDESFLGWVSNLLMPVMTPNEQVLVFHQLYITFFIALAQIGPLWYSEPRSTSTIDMMQSLKAQCNVVLKQTSDLLEEEVKPFQDDDQNVEIPKELKEVLWPLQNNNQREEAPRLLE